MSGATLIWLAAQSAPEAPSAGPGLSRDPRRLGRLNLSSIIDTPKASHPAVHWLNSLARLVERNSYSRPRELTLELERV
jgi:hypothetical protein